MQDVFSSVDFGTIVFVTEPLRLCEAAINSRSEVAIWDAATDFVFNWKRSPLLCLDYMVRTFPPL